MTSIHTIDTGVEDDEEGAAAVLLDLQHQVHLRQAEIDQRDFALLFVHENLESLKLIVRQREHELCWLKKQQAVANRLITHLRNQLEDLRIPIHSLPQESSARGARGTTQNAVYEKSASASSSIPDRGLSPSSLSRSATDYALKTRTNLVRGRCTPVPSLHQSCPNVGEKQCPEALCEKELIHEKNGAKYLHGRNVVNGFKRFTRNRSLTRVEVQGQWNRVPANKHVEGEHEHLPSATAELQSILKEQKVKGQDKQLADQMYNFVYMGVCDDGRLQCKHMEPILEKEINKHFMAYEDREQAFTREIERLRADLELAGKQSKVLRAELRRRDEQKLAMEKTLKELRLDFEESNNKRTTMQRDHAMKLASLIADHEREIGRLERRTAKSSQLRQQEANRSAALIAAAEARGKMWFERSLMAACEASEWLARGEELKYKLDELFLYQLMFTELSKRTRTIESQLCCAVCLQVPACPITFLPCVHTVCENCVLPDNRFEEPAECSENAAPNTCPACRKKSLYSACASITFAFENGAAIQILRQINAAKKRIQELRENMNREESSQVSVNAHMKTK